jgi:hypothetical protein
MRKKKEFYFLYVHENKWPSIQITCMNDKTSKNDSWYVWLYLTRVFFIPNYLFFYFVILFSIVFVHSYLSYYQIRTSPSRILLTRIISYDYCSFEDYLDHQSTEICIYFLLREWISLFRSTVFIFISMVMTKKEEKDKNKAYICLILIILQEKDQHSLMIHCLHSYNKGQ